MKAVLQLLAVVFSLVFVGRCGAEDTSTAKEEDPRLIGLILENDLFYNPAPGEHQDRHYTQGLKFIYLDRGEPVPCWADKLQLDWLGEKLPKIGMDEITSENFGFVIGQNIYTPEDNHMTNLVSSDRPYAGWLYTGLALQRRSTVGTRHIPVIESFELNIGVIGPEAQGEWAQNTVHRVRKLETFDGWDNQLHTEPAFVMRYGRAWRLSCNEKTSRYFDVIPQIGGNLGTVMIDAEAGLTARVGFNLPDDFGPQRIDAPILMTSGKTRGWLGAYAFGRLNGRAVARNVFLDGNLYQHSHRVDKEPFVADLSCGFAVTIGRHFEINYDFVSRTREFEHQKGVDRFGSFTAKLRFGF